MTAYLSASLLVESFIVGAMGSALGLGFAYAALRIILMMAPSGLPRLSEIGVDATVLLFSFGVALLASLLFGTVPALKYAGARLGTGLREAARTASESWQGHRTRDVLVTVQVALAFVLLICSGLMIRTFRNLAETNPGFVGPRDIQTFRVHMSNTDVSSAVNAVRAEEQVEQNLAVLPGVSSVAFASSVPMDGNGSTDAVFAQGRAYSQGEIPPLRSLVNVSPGYFHTMGIPLITGRDVTWSDIDNANPVALVSENFAVEYWGSPTNALDKLIRRSGKNNSTQIIGVVGNVRYAGMNEPPPTSVYFPVPGYEVAFAIRSPLAGSLSFVSEIRRAVWSVDSNLPLANVHTMDFYYSKSMARTSFTLVMLGTAGGMALLLATIGLYGVIAYSMLRRTQEIGIRLALGAQRRNILRLVLGQGTTLTLVGLSFGIASALGLTRFLSSQLYGVTPTDPLTFIGVVVLLTVVALCARYLPALRAMKVDPVIGLRHE